jgi:hypothetical protein
MMPRGIGDNAEQKLKLQIFSISVGLFMLVSSAMFDNWFYFQGVPFSVNAINSPSNLDATAFKHECQTLMSYDSMFVCFCDKDTCSVLKYANLAGWLYIMAIVASLPLYTCVIANINRKIERLPLNFELERDCLDWEVYHFMAPAVVLCGFVTWLLIVSQANPGSMFDESELSLGPAFTNAGLGLLVLLWNVCHYVFSVRRAYRSELTS